MSNSHKEQLEALSEIRNLMERSTKFISLSGLSGVFAGIYALIGAGAAYWRLDTYLHTVRLGSWRSTEQLSFFGFMILDAVLVFAFTLLTAIYFTQKKARKEGLSIFDKAALRVAAHLFFPVAVGGAFCLALLEYGLYGLIAPSMLIFYGLGLVNASKYTFESARYLGVAEVTLGLISAFVIGYGLFFWSIGFGIFHIVYGVYMYLQYER